MTSLKHANRRVGSLFAVAALVLATVTPGLVPAFASAAQLTERSVALSNSSKEMTGVTYTVTFTPQEDAKAVVFDFCSDSPLLGSDCTAPDGFTVAGAATNGGFTRTTGGSNDANTAIYTGTITAPGPVSVNIDHVTNPDDAGTLYVRIATYDGVDESAAATLAKAYASTAIGTTVDEGAAAVSITDTIGVSAAVLESMTFCVAGNVINEDNCKASDDEDAPIALEAPTLKLGEDNGGVVALDSTVISSGNIYTQLSTNAAGGAVVNLKSGNDCGGLMRATAEDCDIVAANETVGAVTAGQARLGVKVNPTGDTAGAFGTLRIYNPGTAFYNITDFKLNYASNGSSGVTSAFGDPILDTADGPASNKNATISFGASVSPQTPAGLYSNDYSLIATGKY